MAVFSELITLILSGLSLMAQESTHLLLLFLAAFALAGLSWFLCNNYVKLWNKRYRLTTTHQTLTIIASVLTFFFVLALGGLFYMKNVADLTVNNWETAEIATDDTWRQNTFRTAYYEVKELNIENFTDNPTPEKGGQFIPVTKKTSQETAARVYATAACSHFDDHHPFLSKIIWSNPDSSATGIAVDVVGHFKKNTGESYDAAKAVSIAAQTIRGQLALQTPRTVVFSRLVLALLYLLVLAIPLSVIGWAAYKDIRVRY
jgi:hypothetical protein